MPASDFFVTIQGKCQHLSENTQHSPETCENLTQMFGSHSFKNAEFWGKEIQNLFWFGIFPLCCFCCSCCCRCVPVEIVVQKRSWKFKVMKFRNFEKEICSGVLVATIFLVNSPMKIGLTSITKLHHFLHTEVHNKQKKFVTSCSLWGQSLVMFDVVFVIFACCRNICTGGTSPTRREHKGSKKDTPRKKKTNDQT